MNIRVALMLATLSSLLGCQAGEPASSAPNPEKTAVARPQPGPVNASPDPAALWAAGAPRIKKTNDYSVQALESRLATISDYLKERKEGARPFAEAVMGLRGKARYSGGLLEQAAGAVAEVFGSKPSDQDSFRDYVMQCYHKHVLDQAKLQKVIDDAIAGYAGDLQSIEAQLLVDLRADLGDEALDWKRALPQMASAKQVRFASSDAIDSTVAVAGNDMAAMVVSEIASAVIGNVISDQLTSETDSFTSKATVNILLGRQVDRAVDGAIGMIGHDPINAAAAKAVESLDDASERIIAGDPIMAKAFITLLMLANRYPDEAVRNACRAAVQAMDSSPRLGLRYRLAQIHLERSSARSLAIYRHLFANDPREAEATLYILDPKSYDPPAELIRWAAQWKARFGGQQP